MEIKYQLLSLAVLKVASRPPSIEHPLHVLMILGYTKGYLAESHLHYSMHTILVFRFHFFGTSMILHTDGLSASDFQMEATSGKLEIPKNKMVHYSIAFGIIILLESILIKRRFVIEAGILQIRCY